MNGEIKLSPVAPPATSPSNGDASDSRARQEADRHARYRLVIEEGPTPGAFIYKTMDRVTGEVVKQLPRAELVRLMGEDRVPAGTVIDTRA